MYSTKWKIEKGKDVSLIKRALRQSFTIRGVLSHKRRLSIGIAAYLTKQWPFLDVLEGLQCLEEWWHLKIYNFFSFTYSFIHNGSHRWRWKSASEPIQRTHIVAHCQVREIPQKFLYLVSDNIFGISTSTLVNCSLVLNVFGMVARSSLAGSVFNY